MFLSSIWTVIASIVVGCAILVSLALLFVRATNIERRWIVSLSTLAFSLLGLYLMIKDAEFVPGRELPTSIASVTLCVLGFVIGRAIDASLGAREVPERSPDPALSTADLAD